VLLLVFALAGCGLAVAVTASADAPGQNVFAGNWSTTRPECAPTCTGTMAFSVIDQPTGSSNLQGFGGQPCAAGAVYYFGQYTDPSSGAGLIYACMAGPGHLVGRYKDGPTGAEGNIDFTFSAPASWSGFNTADGFTNHDGSPTQFSISGTFAGHFSGDGCCPAGTPQPTPTTTPTPESGGEILPGGGGGGGDCLASAARLGSIHVTPNKPTRCRLKGKKPQPAVSQAEKDNSSLLTEGNKNLLLLAILCLANDPDEVTTMCFVVNEVADLVQAVHKDPVDASFMYAPIAAASQAGRSSVSLFCPRGCPGAVRAINAFVGQLQRLEVALSGLANAANRYSGATLAGFTAGIRLQAGLAQAYAGEVADGLAGLTGPARVLITTLGRVGVTTALTSVQINKVAVQLQQNGLGPIYARNLPPGGAPATEIAGLIQTAAANPPPSVSFAQILPPQLPPAPFRAASHAITLPEVGGLLDALHSQRALSSRAYGLLHNDVIKLNKAPNQAAENKALARFRNDINGLNRRLKPATETLLQHAVAGL
jgi:hypothetical protein